MLLDTAAAATAAAATAAAAKNKSPLVFLGTCLKRDQSGTQLPNRRQARRDAHSRALPYPWLSAEWSRVLPSGCQPKGGQGCQPFGVSTLRPCQGTPLATTSALVKKGSDTSTIISFVLCVGILEARALRPNLERYSCSRISIVSPIQAMARALRACPRNVAMGCWAHSVYLGPVLAPTRPSGTGRVRASARRAGTCNPRTCNSVTLVQLRQAALSFQHASSSGRCSLAERNRTEAVVHIRDGGQAPPLGTLCTHREQMIAPSRPEPKLQHDKRITPLPSQNR